MARAGEELSYWVFEKAQALPGSVMVVVRGKNNGFLSGSADAIEGETRGAHTHTHTRVGPGFITSSTPEHGITQRKAALGTIRLSVLSYQNRCPMGNVAATAETGSAPLFGGVVVGFVNDRT